MNATFSSEILLPVGTEPSLAARIMIDAPAAAIARTIRGSGATGFTVLITALPATLGWAVGLAVISFVAAAGAYLNAILLAAALLILSGLMAGRTVCLLADDDDEAAARAQVAGNRLARLTALLGAATVMAAIAVDLGIRIST